MTNQVPEFCIITDYIPGAIGRIVELHGTYYHTHWGFGRYFEAKVASELSEFLTRYDCSRDGVWIADLNGRVEGAIVIDGLHAPSKGAHLRWFIVSDCLRGKGVGRQLLHKAIDFCKSKGYPMIYLWTFEGLHTARRLYEKAGFALMQQHRGAQWGIDVNEQYFELNLCAPRGRES